MLTNTFCHIPTIGLLTERRLWSAGICTWEAFASAEQVPLPASRRDFAARHLAESAGQLAQGNAGYFCAVLPPREHWRLFPHFRRRIAYLDIETTGLGAPGDYITTIALYDGRRVRTYIHGENLRDFADDIAGYGLLVTYNGKSFDIPFIRRYLRLPMGQAHIDLMHVLRSLGCRGGLKGCEQRLGLDRGDLEGVDGFFAVLLWNEYHEKGDIRALKTLLAYNVEDVVNLEKLMTIAYNMKLKQTPFARTHTLSMPERPAVPYAADPATVQRIRQTYYRF